MSIKSKVLDTLLAGLPPANTYNFLVIIGRESVSIASAYASSVNWPSQKRPSLQVIHKGKTFNLPAYSEESSGILTIGFHENMAFYIREQLRLMLKDTENPTSIEYFDIGLVSLSPAMVPITLTEFTHCWFTERSVLSLSHDQVTTPARWEGSFYYNGIKEKPIIPYTPASAMIAAELEMIKSSNRESNG